MMRTFAVVALLVSVVPVAHAQSLADVARTEEARRKKVAKASKLYTNDDLQPDFTTPVTMPPASMTGGAEPGAQPAAGAPAATAAQPGAQGAQAGTAAAAGASPQRDQAYWSARVNEARSAVERNRMFADALQTRINSLAADFVNRDDPVQRAAIEQDRLKALAELERVRKEIENGNKAIADIFEEARRAGVPAGWLR